MKTIEVVAAIITHEGNILATQRGSGIYAGKWEFPGGKIEAGESPEAALRREIREELDVEIKVCRHLTTIEHDYPDFHLIMHCFLSVIANGTLHLNEHLSAKWLSPDNLDDVDWLPADRTILPFLTSN